MLGNLLDSQNFAEILVFGSVGVLVANIIYLVAAYLLNAFALCKMSENLEFKNPKLCFIPLVNVFYLGKIAEMPQEKDIKKAPKYSIVLLVLRAVALVLAIVLLVTTINAVVEILTYANNALEGNEEMTAEMFKSVGSVMVWYIATIVVGILTVVVNYICLWRVFNLYAAENAVLYLIVSILISIFAPIFLFILRNKQANVKIETEEE